MKKCVLLTVLGVGVLSGCTTKSIPTAIKPYEVHNPQPKVAQTDDWQVIEVQAPIVVDDTPHHVANDNHAPNAPTPTANASTAGSKPNTKATTKGKLKSNVAYVYKCQNDSQDSAYVVAKYNLAVQTALINITASELGLDRADVEMRQDKKMRFVNLKNPDSIYVWAVSDDEARLTVTVAGEDYGYHCVQTSKISDN